MSQLPRSLSIASRQSRLALWQAAHVRARIEAVHPDIAVTIVPMTTRGDQILDRSLAKVGGKGLFVKELELALLDGRCDLAVHSMKDVPMTLGHEFGLVAILEREDARDAFVSTRFHSFESLPIGAVVGTSSLRRTAQLRARRPDLVIESLRGNLDTRIAKLDGGHYDAIVLAAAGLTRLGLEARITALLDIEHSLPAPGQGALGIEMLAGREEIAQLLASLDDPDSSDCVRAERAVSRGLGGNCSVPLAAYALVDEGGDGGNRSELHLRALVANESGSRIVTCARRGPRTDPEGLGERVAHELKAAGALDLLGTS